MDTVAWCVTLALTVVFGRQRVCAWAVGTVPLRIRAAMARASAVRGRGTEGLRCCVGSIMGGGLRVLGADGGL
jgi:hypothetical protein